MIEEREKFQKFIENKIPALTLSGGKLTEPQFALEFRVWCHPEHGDDFYFRANTLEEARKLRKRLLKEGGYSKVENILAVVWDNKHKNFREVCL